MFDTASADRAILAGAQTSNDINKKIAQSSESKDDVFAQMASQMGLSIDTKKLGKPDMNIVDLGTSNPVINNTSTEEEIPFVQMPDPIETIIPENDIEKEMIEEMKKTMQEQEDKKKVTTSDNSEIDKKEVNEMSKEKEIHDDVTSEEQYEVKTKVVSDVPLSEIEDEYSDDEDTVEESTEDIMNEYLVSDDDYSNTVEDEVVHTTGFVQVVDDDVENKGVEKPPVSIITPDDPEYPITIENEDGDMIYSDTITTEEETETVENKISDDEVEVIDDEDEDNESEEDVEKESLNDFISEDDDNDVPDLFDDEVSEPKDESIENVEVEEDIESEITEEIQEETTIDEIINDVVPEPTIEEVVEKSEENIIPESIIEEEMNEYELIFSNNVASVKSRYTDKQINEFLTKNSKSVNKDVVKDMYSEERIKYMNHIDFSDTELNSMLWTLVIGKYMDIYYGSTSPTNYQEPIGYTNDTGIVEIIPYGKVDDGKGIDIKEDPAVEELNKHKAREAYKYGKSNIDRAIIEIEDTQDKSDNYDIFEDIRSLEKEFYDSVFYRVLKQVMESDRFANMDDIKMRVIINEQTAYLPVIDFDTGIRLICIDTNDANQYRINPMFLNRNIKFSYNVRAPKLRILYSDNLISRPISTVFALKKLIAYPRYVNPKHIVELKHNFAVAFTTDKKIIDDFEKGNVDAREPGTSTYDQSKPQNRKVGIVILTKKSDRDKQSVRRQQFQQMNQNPLEIKKSIQDYDIHMVLSAGYICNASRLNDISLSPDEKTVQYIITQYNECNTAVIKDGLQCICSAIIKEHREQFGNSVRYSIELEHDRANLVSPSIIAQLDAQDGSIERSETSITNPMDVEISYILPVTRKGMQGVQDFEKGRNDKRFFSKSTIQSRYPYELIRGYNLDTKDGQVEFVKSRGFVEFLEPRSVFFDIMPMSLSMLETSRFHSRMKKKSIESFIDRNSIDLEEMLNDQVLLEYEQGLLGDDTFNGAGRFLYNIIDIGIDLISKENKK